MLAVALAPQIATPLPERNVQPNFVWADSAYRFQSGRALSAFSGVENHTSTRHLQEVIPKEFHKVRWTLVEL